MEGLGGGRISKVEAGRCRGVHLWLTVVVGEHVGGDGVGGGWAISSGDTGSRCCGPGWGWRMDGLRARTAYVYKPHWGRIWKSALTSEANGSQWEGDNGLRGTSGTARRM